MFTLMLPGSRFVWNAKVDDSQTTKIVTSEEHLGKVTIYGVSIAAPHA